MRARPPITPPMMAPVLGDDDEEEEEEEEPVDSETGSPLAAAAGEEAEEVSCGRVVGLVSEGVVLEADEVVELEEDSDSELDVVETIFWAVGEMR